MSKNLEIYVKTAAYGYEQHVREQDLWEGIAQALWRLYGEDIKYYLINDTNKQFGQLVEFSWPQVEQAILNQLVKKVRGVVGYLNDKRVFDIAKDVASGLPIASITVWDRAEHNS